MCPHRKPPTAKTTTTQRPARAWRSRSTSTWARASSVRLVTIRLTSGIVCKRGCVLACSIFLRPTLNDGPNTNPTIDPPTSSKTKPTNQPINQPTNPPKTTPKQTKQNQPTNQSTDQSPPKKPNQINQQTTTTAAPWAWCSSTTGRMTSPVRFSSFLSFPFLWGAAFFFF